MGTRDRAKAQTSDGRVLTRAMRWTIGVVAAVVVAGAVVTGVLLSGPGPVAPPPRADASSAAESASPTPTAAPTPVDGSEVLPPAPKQTDAARLPALAGPTPLATAPLPADAAAQGSLVPGFPAQVAGPAPQSEVVDSSISSDGTTMQVALTARTDQSPDDVTAHYRALWSSLALSPVDAGAGLAYADAYTSVTLAFTSSGTGTLYTVFATLRTA